MIAHALLDACLRDEPLAKYTAARLGGPADLLYIARDAESLLAIAQAAWGDGVPMHLLGGGANVLVSDRGIRGLVVINRAGGLRIDGDQAIVGGGMALSVMARKCAAAGLAGFEWAVSVPGTMGGAVVNNAGAHGGDIARDLIDATIATPQGVAVWTADDLAYAYRESALKRRSDKRFVVLSARLRLTPDDPAAIAARMNTMIAQRKRTQPQGASLGSIFKNPAGDYAGRLIEACGLKGARIGGAQVSPIHANFFINPGDATAADYHALITHVQAVVAERTGVHLAIEVETIGDFSS